MASTGSSPVLSVCLFTDTSGRANLHPRPVDTCSHAIVAVVLPEVHNRVAPAAQGSGNSTVAALVVGDLFHPPGAIMFRRLEAPRATMPKAAVDENRERQVGYHEIGRAGQRLHVAAKLDPALSEDTPCAKFDPRATRPNSPHVLGDGL